MISVIIITGSKDSKASPILVVDEQAASKQEPILQLGSDTPVHLQCRYMQVLVLLIVVYWVPDSGEWTLQNNH